MWRLAELLDRLINGTTMYRLLLYYLVGLLLAAIGLSAAGIIHYSPVDIAIAATTLVLASWLINKALAAIFYAPVNPESSILTGLILALIVPPTLNRFGFLFLLAAAGLAMGSKYVLTIRNKHIFNPAAVAVVLTAWGPRQNASWWVGTAALLPFVIIGGILITRKLRREPMVLTFLAATAAATTLFSLLGGTSVFAGLHNMVLSSAAFFLGFVMLTEPYTSPTTRRWQLWYAAIVGVIMAPQFHIGHFYSTPEVALVIGNIFAYVVGPKQKLFPALRQRLQIASDAADFVFVPDQAIDYLPGQYMEWTLPHDKPDNRGSRRYFTLASSPTEPTLRIGVKFYDGSSSYKEAMLEMDQDTPIVAGQLAGDFVLPADRQQKLAFIAGGIGITPFRSMVKYLLDTRERRDIKLLYAAPTDQDVAYKDVFEAARQQFGLAVTYVLSRAKSGGAHTLNGRINANIIRQAIPDYAERQFFVSGTPDMVAAMERHLADLGVHHSRVKTDFFPGYK